MTINKSLIIGLVVLVVVVLVGMQLPVREVGERQPTYTTNIGELTGGSLVGQTFVASRNDLSGVSVMLATYSGRVQRGEVELHLRRSPDDTQDLRLARARVSELGDNQLHRFEFEPIKKSQGQPFFFYLVSPGAGAGEAVTVDVDGRDPYPQGSAYLVRGAGEDQEISSESIARSGKQSLDVAFETYYTVPGLTAARHQTVALGRHLVGTWDEMRGQYVLWAKVAAPGAILLILMLSLRRAKMKTGQVLALLFVLAVAGRLMYAVELPLTNDEGNYLYDARTLLQGKLAGGDGYVKAPLVVAWLALWQLVAGQTISAGRLASVVVGAATLFPLYLLGRELWSKKVGLAVGGLWSLLGVTTVFSIYAHTQPLALFLGVTGLAVLLVALRGKRGINDDRRRIKLLVLVGVLFGLGVVSRKSILALGLAPLALVILEDNTWRKRITDLLIIGFGFGLVVSIFLSLASYVYGGEGFWEMLGANSAEDGITAVDPAEAEQVRAYSLRGMTPFFRESLPLILLAVLGLGVYLERLGNLIFASLIPRPSAALLVKLVWLLPICVFWWAWGFFAEYEGSAVMVFGMAKLWYAMAAVLLLVAIFYRGGKAKDWRRELSAVVVPVLWFGGLVFFYTNWIKFHANYIGEFLPPLVLLGGLGVVVLLRKSKVRVLYLLVLAWALFLSGYVTLVFEHTGTFQLAALQEAAAWAKENIPLEEPIFTGAAAVPYLSGHHVVLDIAHPRWYAYEFTRKDTARLNTFLPPAEEMVRAFRDAKWFMLDKQTGFSFLMEYAEIEGGLERDWETVKGIANGSNTLTFYRRIK